MTGAGSARRIVPLDGRIHDRSAFERGASELDRYLREHATQDVRRHLARVFVAVGPDGTRIDGYYGLSATSVRRERLPSDQAGRLPGYPVPAALIGRLAVHVVVVDALNDDAAAFYGRCEFLRFVDQPGRLFLPFASIARLAPPRGG